MIRVNDTDYDASRIRDNRAHIIWLRDVALKDNDFDWAVVLSVTVGLLDALAEIVEKGEQER